eukprot:2855126-Prymnesium_polylepis.1
MRHRGTPSRFHASNTSRAVADARWPPCGARPAPGRKETVRTHHGSLSKPSADKTQVTRDQPYLRYPVNCHTHSSCTSQTQLHLQTRHSVFLA